jgi:hypothetical protein
VKSRQGYKGYVIEARSCKREDDGFSAEFSVGAPPLWVHGCNLGLHPRLIGDTRPMS